MISIDLSECVVVFDLDDTIYPEADYVESGISFVSHKIFELYGVYLEKKLLDAFRNDPNVNWLMMACSLSGISASSFDSLLWMYRLHTPNIKLSAINRETLVTIRSKAKAVAILTDGRSITQKLKLHSLGLSEWPAYISEQYGSSKPSPERFMAIENDYQAESYVYIGDNISKDFIGCNLLGWITVGVRGNQRNINQHNESNFPHDAQPKYWIRDIEELPKLFF